VRTFIVSDTSLLLSFVCANEHDLLIKFSGADPIYIPEAVANEMERKLNEPRFSCGRSRWMRLKSSQHIEIFEDNDGLLSIVRGFAGFNYTYQGGLAKNLGEFMCIAHCIQEQEKGARVALLADDGDARRIAQKRSIPHFGSEQVLLRAIQLGLLTTMSEARKTWSKLSEFDIHVPFDSTALSNPATYR